MLVAGFVMFALPASAQKSKLSALTQMAIDERDGKIVLPDINGTVKPKPGLSVKGVDAKDDLVAIGLDGVKLQRPIAPVETRDGVKTISCIVRMNPIDEAALQAKGVTIDATFTNFVTAHVPLDSIESVAALDCVTAVKVAKMMKLATDESRKASNVDDVLTHSADAVAAGLDSAYTGKGVVLGVIDQGIDFQHVAFKDSEGNSRIKKAYCYWSSLKEFTGSAIDTLTTAYKSGSHGSHTCSTAGGSNVKISVSNKDTTAVVVDDPAEATYGGMAPKADLVLCDLGGNLTDANIMACMQNIYDYAESVGKPCVISLSLGAVAGPHDGTGEVADLCKTLAEKGAIIVYAAANEAGRSIDSGTGYFTKGGMYCYKENATSSDPLTTVLSCHAMDGVDGGTFYLTQLWAFARTEGVELAVKYMVVDTVNNKVVYTSSAITSNKEESVSSSSHGGSSLSSYYQAYSTETGGYMCVYFDQVDGDKKNVVVYPYYLLSKKYAENKANGLICSRYRLAVQIYPKSGTSTIDCWNASSGYENALTTPISGYTFVDGTDACSSSDEASYNDIITVGAYVTKNKVTNYKGTSVDLSESFPTVGDIAYFSSYTEEGYGPKGEAVPYVAAPGATIVAAVNHYDASYMSDTYADYGEHRVVSPNSYSYGNMEGTSMATPAVAGIIALWAEAAESADTSLSIDFVKEIIRNTAISDEYTTTGANATHFGNYGKINALAGIRYILKKAHPDTVDIAVGKINYATAYYGDKRLKVPETVTACWTGQGVTDETTGVSTFESLHDLQSRRRDSARNGLRSLCQRRHPPLPRGRKQGTRRRPRHKYALRLR